MNFVHRKGMFAERRPDAQVKEEKTEEETDQVKEEEAEDDEETKIEKKWTLPHDDADYDADSDQDFETKPEDPGNEEQEHVIYELHEKSESNSDSDDGFESGASRRRSSSWRSSASLNFAACPAEVASGPGFPSCQGFPRLFRGGQQQRNQKLNPLPRLQVMVGASLLWKLRLQTPQAQRCCQCSRSGKGGRKALAVRRSSTPVPWQNLF